MKNIKFFKEKMSRKKMLVLIVILALLIACIAGSIYALKHKKPAEPSLDEIVSGKLLAYETDLTDSLSSMETNADVSSYLMTWASNKKIDASRDSSGNVIYNLPASSKSLKKETPVVLLCEYDADHMLSYTESIATALTVAKNTDSHGPFKVVFSAVSEGNHVGLENLEDSTFSKDAEVFCIGKTDTSRVSVNAGGYRHFVLTDKLRYTDATYNTAYKITISGMDQDLPGNRINGSQNPIKMLGNLLANFKSTSFLFELASFNGGDSADITPSGASMTILVSDADESKLTSKLDNAIEKFREKFDEEEYPDITYSYKKTSVPKKVIVRKDTDNIASLMYTAMNGVSYKDDNGIVVSIDNIGKVTTKGGTFRLDISSMSFSEDYLDEAADSYKTIAGLCNMKYKQVKSYPAYTSAQDFSDAADVSAADNADNLTDSSDSNGSDASDEENNTLLSAFETAFLDYTGDSEMKVEGACELSSCSILKSRGIEVSMLWCGITSDTKEKFAGTFITYLTKLDENAE